MSKDHKPQHTAEKARVVRAGGRVTAEGRINGNLNLSRALGDFEYKNMNRKQPERDMISGVPDVRSRDLRTSDEYLLIACDGIWELFRGSQRQVDIARGRLQPDKLLSATTGELLTELMAPTPSESGLGMDNMAAILVLLPVKDPTAARSRSKPVEKRPAAK